MNQEFYESKGDFIKKYLKNLNRQCFKKCFQNDSLNKQCFSTCFEKYLKSTRTTYLTMKTISKENHTEQYKKLFQTIDPLVTILFDAENNIIDDAERQQFYFGYDIHKKDKL